MSPFHDGELAVQRRAGLADEAARLEGMLRRPILDGGAAKFLAQREFAALTGRDPQGRLWTSPLRAPEGFLEAHGSTLTIHTTPADTDPLHKIPAGQQVGLIVVEFAIRRRVRVNGLLTTSADDRLEITADQAYGNCPSYIHPRLLPDATSSTRSTAEDGLQGADLIATADTFFLGTAHPDHGADTSHKGGQVIVDGNDLWWPDHPGNNMFNSLGNLAANPEAALLFPDLGAGRTLQLSGTATIEWDAPTETGRAVRFRPDRSVLTTKE